LVYKTDNQRHGVVLMDQSSRDDTLVDVGPPGATPTGAVSRQSSRDKHAKRSARGSSMRGEGKAISTVDGDGKCLRLAVDIRGILVDAMEFEAATGQIRFRKAPTTRRRGGRAWCARASHRSATSACSSTVRSSA